MLVIKSTYPIYEKWSIKMKRYFFKSSFTRAKTDKQYDTKRELYSHDFIYVTHALLNKVANVHQILWANQTKL